MTVMQYLRKTFWDISGKDADSHRRDNIIYVIFFTVCVFYFPKGSLPESWLTQHDKPFHVDRTINSKSNIQSMSNSEFRIPFIGCFSRMTVTYRLADGRLSSTKHLWDIDTDEGVCEGLNLSYRIVKEGERFHLYYLRPFQGNLTMTNEINEDINAEMGFVLYYAPFNK